MVYTISGSDTLTVVATNLLGSDTATLVVNVTYVPLPGSPVVSLQGYAYATLCDTASFEVTLLEGDTTGLTYTWHSAKADRGEATLHPEGSRLKVAYSAINFDTITVVVSNVLGWRSATVTTRVILCEVRDTLPFVATLTEGGSNIYAHFFDWQDERICAAADSFTTGTDGIPRASATTRAATAWRAMELNGSSRPPSTCPTAAATPSHGMPLATTLRTMSLCRPPNMW